MTDVRVTVDWGDWPAAEIYTGGMDRRPPYTIRKVEVPCDCDGNEPCMRQPPDEDGYRWAGACDGWREVPDD